MLQFATLAALLAFSSATLNYGGLRSARSLQYGGANRALVSGYGAVIPAGLVAVNTGLVNTGYSRLATTGLVGGYTLGAAAVAPLAVQTVHNIQYVDAPSGGSVSPISVDIPANPVPINMVFRSASSQLNVQQAHQGAAGTVQESSSEDEAHVLKHSVTKPVLQEIREVITPFRKITQEIQPVREEINTIVARGSSKAVVQAAPVAAVQAVQAVPVQAVQVQAVPVQTVQVQAAPVQTINRGVVGVTRIVAPVSAIQTIATPATSAVEVDVDVQGSGAVVKASESY